MNSLTIITDIETKSFWGDVLCAHAALVETGDRFDFSADPGSGLPGMDDYLALLNVATKIVGHNYPRVRCKMPGKAPRRQDRLQPGIVSLACLALSAAANRPDATEGVAARAAIRNSARPGHQHSADHHQAALLLYDTLMAHDEVGWIRRSAFTRWCCARTYASTTVDGSLVRAIDVVASLRRWAPRDHAGMGLSPFGMQIAVVDERTFTIETPSPTRMALFAPSAPSDPRSTCMHAAQ